MSSYFRSLLAEVLPGWAFWRSSRQSTTPLHGQPLGSDLEPKDTKKPGGDSRSPSGQDQPGDQPPVDPDSENRRLQ